MEEMLVILFDSLGLLFFNLIQYYALEFNSILQVLWVPTILYRPAEGTALSTQLFFFLVLSS